MEIPEGEEREKGIEEIFEVIRTMNFPVIYRHQTTDSESSESTQQDKYQKINTEVCHIQTTENQQQKKS